MALLAAVAGVNLSAGAAHRRTVQAEADRIDASVRQVGGIATAAEFALATVVTNHGPGPLRLLPPRLDPAVYAVIPTDQPVLVPGRSSVQLSVHLRARCPAPRPTPFGIVVALSSASGRRHDVVVAASPDLVDDLVSRACAQASAQ